MENLPSDPNTSEGQLKIFRKSLSSAKKLYQPGTNIILNGTSQQGKVTFIRTDISDVAWVNGKPFFLEIEMADGKVYQCSPSQIRKGKK